MERTGKRVKGIEEKKGERRKRKNEVRFESHSPADECCSGKQQHK